MAGLYQIQEAVRLRAQEITDTYAEWPCRKGCDDCCRNLASIPQVTSPEWELLAAALDALPLEVAEGVRQRIRENAGRPRPVSCPLLDTRTGSCLVYQARPVACRAYGFYAERQYVLGCARIETLAGEGHGVVWGNHTALEERLQGLGTQAKLSEWMSGGYGG